MYRLRSRLYRLLGQPVPPDSQDQILLRALATQIRRIAPQFLADDFLERVGRCTAGVVVNDDLKDTDVGYPRLVEAGFRNECADCDAGGTRRGVRPVILTRPEIARETAADRVTIDPFNPSRVEPNCYGFRHRLTDHAGERASPPATLEPMPFLGTAGPRRPGRWRPASRGRPGAGPGNLLGDLGGEPDARGPRQRSAQHADGGSAHGGCGRRRAGHDDRSRRRPPHHGEGDAAGGTAALLSRSRAWS